MSPFENVLYEVRDRVAVIHLNRPEALNAFTAAMGVGLRKAVGAAVADDAVRVIVLTGSGRGFCAGADMKLLQGIKTDTASVQKRAEQREGASCATSSSTGSTT